MEVPVVDRIATMFDYEQVFTESERLLREKFELPVYLCSSNGTPIP